MIIVVRSKNRSKEQKDKMVEVGSCLLLRATEGQEALPPAGLQQNCSSLVYCPFSLLPVSLSRACSLIKISEQIKLFLATIALSTVSWLVVFVPL